MPKPVITTTAGTNLYQTYSGTAGGDVNIWSGAGVVLNVTPTVASLSGQAIVLYDSAIAVSGGPLATSGHKIVAVIGAGPLTGASGNVQQASPVFFGSAFTSGLCIASRSGMVGAIVSFTPIPS